MSETYRQDDTSEPDSTSDLPHEDHGREFELEKKGVSFGSRISMQENAQ